MPDKEPRRPSKRQAVTKKKSSVAKRPVPGAQAPTGKKKAVDARTGKPLSPGSSASKLKAMKAAGKSGSKLPSVGAEGRASGKMRPVKREKGKTGLIKRSKSDKNKKRDAASASGGFAAAKKSAGSTIKAKALKKPETENAPDESDVLPAKTATEASRGKKKGKTTFNLAMKFSLPVSILLAVLIITWGYLIGRQMQETVLNDIKKSGASHVMGLTALGRTMLDARQKAQDQEGMAKVWPVTMGLMSEKAFGELAGTKSGKAPNDEQFEKAILKASFLKDFTSYLENKNRFDPSPAARPSNEVLDAYILDTNGHFVAGAREYTGKVAISDVNWLTTGLDTVKIGDKAINLSDMGIDVNAGVIERDGKSRKVLVFKRKIIGGWSPGLAILALSADVIENEIGKVQKLMVIVGIAAMLLGVFVCVLIASFVTRPAKILIQDMEVVAQGNLDHRTKAHSGDEIGQIAVEFNSMTHKLLLAAQAEKEQQRLENELEMAHEIQMKLLPPRVPKVRGFDITATYKSAKEVGGDYYDFFPIDKEHLGIIVADVSGKGIPGSMVMATTRTVLHFVATNNRSAANTMARTNAIVAGDIKRGMFVTAFYLVLNVRTRSIVCASAGHNPMVLHRATGEVELVNPSGIALGFDKGPIFQRTIKEQDFQINKGDRIVLYTDGVVEAMNSKSEEYTDERFYDFVKNNQGLNSKDFVAALLADLERHKGKAEQHDDITVVTLKVE